MNKRIKIKKGLLHKKCDNKCINYRIIEGEKLITNNICKNCKLRNNEEIQRILKSNRYIDCSRFVEIVYKGLENKGV